jgi:hypothetical protein
MKLLLFCKLYFSQLLVLPFNFSNEWNQTILSAVTCENPFINDRMSTICCTHVLTTTTMYKQNELKPKLKLKSTSHLIRFLTRHRTVKRKSVRKTHINKKWFRIWNKLYSKDHKILLTFYSRFTTLQLLISKSTIRK